ncbi:hypothetical protein EPUL_003777, partial [Erysiphe pulchra]
GPTRAWLDRIHYRLAARIASADIEHPLRHCWDYSHMSWIRRRQSLELSAVDYIPSWCTVNREENLRQVGAVGRLWGLESFNGSRDEAGNVGAGYCIYRGLQEVASQKIPLGQKAEIFDAEVIGALEGLRVACSHLMSRYATNVAVCLDNQEAAVRLHSGLSTLSSCNQIQDGSEGPSSCKMGSRYQKIVGNERADYLAKQACSEETLGNTISIARAKRLAQDRYNKIAVQYWQKNAPERYRKLNITMSTKMPPELFFLTRYSLGKLLAARNGHGDFADYHRRFHHGEAENSCDCGAEKSPDHPSTAK